MMPDARIPGDIARGYDAFEDGWRRMVRQSALTAEREARAERERERDEALAERATIDDLAVVVDCLSAWRYCPLATSENPSRECLERTARQLLAELPSLADRDRYKEALEEVVASADRVKWADSSEGRFGRAEVERIIAAARGTLNPDGEAK